MSHGYDPGRTNFNGCKPWNFQCPVSSLSPPTPKFSNTRNLCSLERWRPICSDWTTGDCCLNLEKTMSLWVPTLPSWQDTSLQLLRTHQIEGGCCSISPISNKKSRDSDRCGEKTYQRIEISHLLGESVFILAWRRCQNFLSENIWLRPSPRNGTVSNLTLPLKMPFSTIPLFQGNSACYI